MKISEKALRKIIREEILHENDINSFANQVKSNGSSTRKGYKFSFTDEDFVNDKPGEYIYTHAKLKDGIVIVQYDIEHKEVVLVQGVEGVTKRVKNPNMLDLDQIIDYVDELSELDEISTSYTNPVKDLELDDITPSFIFRSKGTNLLDVIETSLGIEIPHGKMLGAGAEGEVYDYGNSKIIKFFILPDNKKTSVLSFLKKLESLKSEHIANVYDSGIAVRIGQKLLVGELSSFNSPIWIAYYISDKVFPIKGERDERKVEKLKSALIEDLGLDPWDFYDNPDNIMQDFDGNYVYVDFGSVADFLK